MLVESICLTGRLLLNYYHVFAGDCYLSCYFTDSFVLPENSLFIIVNTIVATTGHVLDFSCPMQSLGEKPREFSRILGDGISFMVQCNQNKDEFVAKLNSPLKKPI